MALTRLTPLAHPFKQILLNVKKPLVQPFIRTNWNKDWKPGPYPRSPEERVAAAKKYGLLPEDYEPYPETDDGHDFGDYPKLPIVSGDARDPYHLWDYPELKRDFHEPLHVDCDIYGEDRYNANARPQVSYPRMLATFLTVMVGGYFVFQFFEKHKVIKPLMPQQFPYRSEAHYSFEPLD